MGDVIGHTGAQRELLQLALGESPSHALLLAGPVGTGRTLLATFYARALNCEAREPPAGASLAGLEPTPAEVPCGTCRPCRLIAAGNHPDVVVMAPGDSFCKPRPDETHEKHPLSRDIRICQVRGVVETIARFPFEARYRVIVIEPADLFARDAVQAMLKTLEEPPPRNAFVLITAAPEALPETILSRCRRIDIRPVPRREIEAALLARGVDAGLAARVAVEARGLPARAIAFAAHPGLMEDLGRLLERCATLAGAGTAERLAYANDLSERWRRDRSLVTVELDAWEVFWERELRRAADGEGAVAPLEALGALQAVAAARQDLHDYVMARAALELMLLRFPRATINESGEPSAPPKEEPAAYA
jgi:DNA polymerase-3 subunit delta'